MATLKEIYNLISFIAITYFGFSLVTVATVKDIAKMLDSPTEIINLLVSILGFVFTVVYIVYAYKYRKEALKNIRLTNELKKYNLDECKKTLHDREHKESSQK